MSVDAMIWAARQVTGSSLTKCALWALADYLNQLTGQCNPSYPELAKKAEMSVAAIKLHIGKLKALGLIEVHHVFAGKKKQVTNHYVVHYKTRGVQDVRQASTTYPTGVHQVATNQEVNQELEPTYIANDSEESDVSDFEEAQPVKDNIPYSAIVDAYHHFLPNLPRKLKISPKLKAAIKSRWREDKRHQNLEFWQNYFDNVNLFEFYAKPKPDAWICTFDHLVTSSKFDAMVEKIQHHYSRSQ